MEEMDEPSPRTPPAWLRFVWTNPAPPVPRQRVNLAVAIERQLDGDSGLTGEQFVVLYAQGRPEGSEPAAALALLAPEA